MMKTYETSHANFNLLLEAELPLSTEDAHKFQNLMLGALSVEVDPVVWADCIELCKEELARANRKIN